MTKKTTKKSTKSKNKKTNTKDRDKTQVIWRPKGSAVGRRSTVLVLSCLNETKMDCKPGQCIAYYLWVVGSDQQVTWSWWIIAVVKKVMHLMCYSGKGITLIRVVISLKPWPRKWSKMKYDMCGGKPVVFRYNENPICELKPKLNFTCCELRWPARKYASSPCDLSPGDIVKTCLVKPVRDFWKIATQKVDWCCVMLDLISSAFKPKSVWNLRHWPARVCLR